MLFYRKNAVKSIVKMVENSDILFNGRFLIDIEKLLLYTKNKKCVCVNAYQNIQL